MLTDLNLTDWSALLTVLFTAVITVANLLMWFSTRKTIRMQTQSNYSLNYQALIQGHRELFFGLLEHPDVFTRFCKANKLRKGKLELQYVTTFFINQTLLHYVNFEHETLDQSHLESFKADAREVFSLPLIQKRWQHAKNLYPDNFRRFVDEELYPKPVPTA